MLLSIDDYRKLSGGSLSIVDLLGMPGVEDIEFDPPRLGDVHRPADLS